MVLNRAKKDTAWDPFNENQGSGTIYNTLFPLSNMNIVSVGGSINPLEDVTATTTWSGLWAADICAATESSGIISTGWWYDNDRSSVQIPSKRALA